MDKELLDIIQEMSHKNELCYVILTYNNYQDTIETVEGILNQSIIQYIDIVVVDNNSSEFNKNKLEQYLCDKEVTYYYRSKNDGYAGGNNYAWIQLKRVYKYLFFVNDDIVFKSCKLTEKIIEIFENHPMVGMIGPEVLVEDEKPIELNNRQKLFFSKGIFHHRYKYWKDYREIDSIIGCFFAIRTDIPQMDFLFDESFFMYTEEYDLCLRVWAKGYSVIKISKMEYSIYHKGGASPTFTNGGYWKEYLGNRNAVLCLRNLHGIEKFKLIIFYIISCVKKMFRRESIEFKRSVLAGYMSGIYILIMRKDYIYIKNDALKSVRKYSK